MDCSTPGFPSLHYLPELAQTHVHWVSDANPTFLSSVTLFSSCPQSFPVSGSFPVNRLFASSGRSTGASEQCLACNKSLRKVSLSSIYYLDVNHGVFVWICGSQNSAWHKVGTQRIMVEWMILFICLLTVLPWLWYKLHESRKHV